MKNVKNYLQFINEGLSPVDEIKTAYNKLKSNSKVVEIVKSEITKNQNTSGVKSAVEKLKQYGNPEQALQKLNTTNVPANESLLNEGKVWDWIIKSIPIGGALSGIATIITGIMKNPEILSFTQDAVFTHAYTIPIGLGILALTLIYTMLVKPILQSK